MIYSTKEWREMEIWLLREYAIINMRLNDEVNWAGGGGMSEWAYRGAAMLMDPDQLYAAYKIAHNELEKWRKKYND